MSELIRFRCPGCQVTLKIDESKAGAHMGCPRCGREVVVPSATSVLQSVGPQPAAGLISPPIPVTESAEPLAGFLNLDLRLDPELGPSGKPLSLTHPSTGSGSSAETTPTASPAVAVAPSPGPSLRSEKLSLRSRDVQLPRTAVVAWSTLVLLAQVFAFLAGLLVGHFVWR